MSVHAVIIEDQLWSIWKREDGRVVCRIGKQETLAQAGWDHKCGHCHMMNAFPKSTIEGMNIVLPEGVSVDNAFEGLVQNLRGLKVTYNAI